MDTMDLSDLAMALPKNYTLFQCSHCKLLHEKKWMTQSSSMMSTCFFCSMLRSPKITRYALLKEIEWFYIRSGETNRREFYEDYLNQVERWCDNFKIPHTELSISLEHDLRSADEMME
jgi:hypothetical protein